MDLIKTQRQDNLLHLSLNRPEAANALTPAMLKQMTAQVKAAQKDSQLRGIVLSGVGKNFCSGADLHWLSESKEDFSCFQEMYQTLWDCDLPLIGKVQGRILGGGVGLVSLCDFVICAQEAEFSLPESRWGLIPGILTPFLIAKIGASRFLAKSLTASEFSAQQAFEWGLVHEICPMADLEKALSKVSQSICSQSPQALKKIKQTVRQCQNISPELILLMAKASSEMKSSEEAQVKISSFLKAKVADKLKK